MLIKAAFAQAIRLFPQRGLAISQRNKQFPVCRNPDDQTNTTDQEEVFQDGVTILEIGEDVWGLGSYFNGHIDELVDAFETTHKEIAPETELRLSSSRVSPSMPQLIQYLFHIPLFTDGFIAWFLV